MNVALSVCLAVLLCGGSSGNCITNNCVVYQALNQSQKAIVVGRVKGVRECAVNLSIPSRIASFDVVGIKEEAFLNDVDLHSVKIENGIWWIGDRAFKGCSGLVRFNLPESLLVLGNEAFMDCIMIDEVRLPSVLTDDSGFGAFRGCTRLKRVIFSDGLSCNVIPFFYGCTELAGFQVGKNQHYQVYEGCLYDKSMSMFIRCPNKASHTNVCVHAGVKYIADFAFGGCRMVKCITIPDSVSEIGMAAFCMSGLETLTLPDGISNLSVETFAGCENLRSVYIPCDVRYIGINCFADTKELRQLFFKGDRPVIEDDDVCIGAKDCVVFAPKGAQGWESTNTVWGLAVKILEH